MEINHSFFYRYNRRDRTEAKHLVEEKIDWKEFSRAEFRAEHDLKPEFTLWYTNPKSFVLHEWFRGPYLLVPWSKNRQFAFNRWNKNPRHAREMKILDIFVNERLGADEIDLITRPFAGALDQYSIANKLYGTRITGHQNYSKICDRIEFIIKALFEQGNLDATKDNREYIATPKAISR